MIPVWLDSFNAIAWILSNILVAYIALALLVFVTGYFILFDPGATTAGKFVFRFAVSLLGVIGLIVISLFFDPSHGREWFSYPTDVLFWRPFIRLLAYGYVAYAVTALAILIAVRKWKPDLLRTALDRELLKERTQDHKEKEK